MSVSSQQAETTNLSLLVKERGKIKAALTRFKNFINLVTREADEFNEVSIRLEKAETLFDKFNSVQNNIESLVDDDKIISEEAEREKFENEYYKVISDARQILKSPPIQNLPSGTNDLPTNDRPNLPQNSNLQASIKLPVIDLPTFDGTHEQYLYFRDTFEKLIHRNDCLAPVQKFHYLRSSLRGKARDMIQNLELSNENYQEAWKLVKERFDNKRLLTSKHVKGLFNVPTLQKESYNDLRELLDNFQKHLRALKVLKKPVEQWDCLIVHLITSKLDSFTRRKWEEETRADDEPTVDQLISFLNQRCQILEALQSEKRDQSNTTKNKAFVAVNNTVKCPKCSGEHYIQNCVKFLSLTPELRSKEIQSMRLCLNCLRPGHFSKNCKSSKCRKCAKAHNTLIHFSTSNSNQNSGNVTTNSAENTQNERTEKENVSTACVSHNSQNVHQTHAFLSTALVKVKDKDGQTHTCRALLDSGSESNFVTDRLCNKLGVEKSEINFCVAGITESLTKINHSVQITIRSRLNSYNKTLFCLVMPKITEKIPTMSVSFDTKLNIPSNIKLADPTFNTPGDIDLLIGVNTFYELQAVGQIFLEQNSIRLQKTLLGWIVSGPILTNNNVLCNLSVNKKRECEPELAQLNKFWELEEIHSANHLSQGELFCEENFIKTTTRSETGQFIVTLPLNKNIHELGDSKTTAINRFLSLERRFQSNPNLKELYCDFIHEYIKLGHMSKTKNNGDSEFEYFLPHHAVLKPDSTTTKLRVVFDGSAKTSSGVSLNDCQFIGPTIQDELFSILLRFRKYKFVIIADVAKMYRMVLVNEIHRPLQKIVWRFDPTEEIEQYELNTVTYGTAAASFLATRALQQTAFDCESKYPEAAKTVKRDFYVDDMLTGSDSESDLITLGTNIRTILQTGGFELRKWASNSHKVLEEFLSNNNVPPCTTENLGETKALGICFSTASDEFYYSINLLPHQNVSKRTILSDIASIFDPLGLLSPVVIKAKLMIQILWQAGLSWDESLPTNLHYEWLKFKEKLSDLKKLRVPRKVVCENNIKTELHGFADASEKAYVSCLYIRSQASDGSWKTRLLCAKTKVAPLKRTTLPRLELCAALLLVKLLKKITDSVEMNFDKIYLWTDSFVALSWIRGDPNRWQTFVSNRVAQIQDGSDINCWHHITSKNNPADCATRGMNPTELIHCKLWWDVPWLSSDETNWPIQLMNETKTLKLPETIEKIHANVVHNVDEKEFELFTKFSSLDKLQRVTAYVLRFYFNLKDKTKRELGKLSVHELERALHYLVRVIQQKHFKSEISSLSRGVAINKQSKLLSLAPFLDEQNILRVGGRLSNSSFSFEKKHPILLPKNHAFTHLVLRDYHLKLLHCGPQMLLFSVREKFWPISGKNAAKKVVRDCVICFRVNPKATPYLMGDLPKSRTESLFPFANTGIDFGGPFLLKNKTSRGSRSVKCYICLFVCLATRAIHLELVLNLTTDGMLSALKRFFARRGKSSHIFSDNGRNFIGASKELAKIYKSISESNWLSQDKIYWHFIPPHSPNFGGIWEAGIKSTKHHLKRVVGNSVLTYDEFITILAQVEAVLNSRPLSPMSDNPNDLNPITPGHFLIGKALTSTPDHDVLDIPENRLSRYQKMQQIVQRFWKRWSIDYISQLQHRTKWKQKSSIQLKVGAMVVVREDNLPPSRWRLGRIRELHPGNDGVTRVVSVQCCDSVIKRPVSKVCVLPIDIN